MLKKMSSAIKAPFMKAPVHVEEYLTSKSLSSHGLGGYARITRNYEMRRIRDVERTV